MINIQKTDPETFEIIGREIKRQNDVIEMIASENYASKAVLEASGSVLTNKYAEGYPRKRYYEGNYNIDDAEELAIERAKKLFGAEHVNVQALSGSPANMAAYTALLEPGDKVMAMNLAHGGHLTHGSPVNFSGKVYNFIAYGVEKETGIIDMDKVRELALKEKPKLILSGYTAYPRTVKFKEFDEIADEVGAYSMADVAHIAGLIAAEQHPSPFPFTDVVTTTTHKTLRGPRGAMIMCKEEFGQAIDKAVFPGLQGGPHEHIIAAKAVCFKEAMQPEFKEYAAQIIKNTKVFAEELMSNGIDLVSGGTDNHLVLVDLTKKKLTGKEVAKALDNAGICANKNMVPFDTQSPFVTSGVRIGTPACTTRGMKEDEMKEIAECIAKVVENVNDENVIKSVKERTLELCKRFPVYEF
tara:strand:- start:13290 stop:14528 length:1239 start_codon:yes stop_codon:yes gene_type:complete